MWISGWLIRHLPIKRVKKVEAEDEAEADALAAVESAKASIQDVAETAKEEIREAAEAVKTSEHQDK